MIFFFNQYVHTFLSLLEDDLDISRSAALTGDVQRRVPLVVHVVEINAPVSKTVHSSTLYTYWECLCSWLKSMPLSAKRVHNLTLNTNLQLYEEHHGSSCHTQSYCFMRKLKTSWPLILMPYMCIPHYEVYPGPSCIHLGWSTNHFMRNSSGQVVLYRIMRFIQALMYTSRMIY